MRVYGRHLLILTLIICGYALVWLLRYSLNEYLLSIINFVGIYIILASSLNLCNGFTGLFSLGHPAFMAIGGYVTAILTLPLMRKEMFLPDIPPWLASLELPFLIALLLGGIAAALIAWLVSLPVLRLKGHYLAVATLGLIIITTVLITNIDTYTRGPLGLNGLADLTNLWWVYSWGLITVIVCLRIKFSSFGRTFQAVREDEMAAHSMGVNLFVLRVQAMVIGAFFAGIAGGLWAHLVTAITPKSFSIALAFYLVVMVVVGGSGSITGTILAAIFISCLTEVFRPVEQSLNTYGIGECVLALILILTLIFRPKGLYGSGEPAWLEEAMHSNK